MKKILFTLLTVLVASSSMLVKAQATDLASDSILVVFFAGSGEHMAE